MNVKAAIVKMIGIMFQHTRRTPIVGEIRCLFGLTVVFTFDFTESWEDLARTLNDDVVVYIYTTTNPCRPLRGVCQVSRGYDVSADRLELNIPTNHMSRR